MSLIPALPHRRPLALALACGVVAVTAAAPAPAAAQARLEAHYVASLASLPIGEGTWTLDLAEDRYTASVIGATTGLIKVFTGGEGASKGHGVVLAGQPISSSYSALIKTTRKTDEVQLTVADGAVKDFKVVPPVDSDPERVPVTDAERRNVMDPMSASLVHVPGHANPLTPDSCQRTLSIFDGRLRYNLKLAFKRMDTVKADKGYAGPVVVCSVFFAPVAGFIPTRATIKYLVAMRDAEVWLAPVAGTRILVPFRAQAPTPIGLGVVEATHFVSIPQPTKASAKGTKVQ